MSNTKTKAAPSHPAKAAPAPVAPAQPAKAAPVPPSTGRPQGIFSKVLQTVGAAYKSFAERSIGLGYASYPALIDDCLDRAVVSMRVVTGTGTQVLDVTGTDTVLHPSIVGVNTALAGATYQVTVGYSSESDTWTVTASPGVSWSVLVLYQKAKR